MKDYQKVHPSAKKLWTIHGIIWTVILAGIAFFIFFMFYHHLWIFLILIVLGVLGIFISPGLEYRQWKYAITRESVDIVHGILWVTQTIIPINRVQHINISQGFIQKRYDLATLEIYTASGKHNIDGIHKDVAGEIAANLNQIVLGETNNEQS